ncbi:uncharacterized protein LOC132545028 [Ylistrum balloti]|uniref:uncharacterized protein LOC132545028 n=1 Tax=Ylistrum balloti TaxID=509963 RepID=UPI0029057F2D|nr:uncharacterized protein LOC132545028 [Ylistrum balloti]
MNTNISVNSSLTNNMSLVMNASLQDNSSYYYYGSGMADCHTLYCILVTRYRNSVYQALLTLSSLLGVIGFVGVTGNSVVILVFARTTSKHTSMYFMLLLAIMDLMVCVFVIPYVIVTEWRITVHYDAVCKIFEMLRYFSIPTSAMILVAISCDRYILICTPPSIRMKKSVSKIVIGMILVLGVMFSLPPILGIGVYATDYSGNQFYIGYCVPNDQYITPHQLDIYWYVVTAAFSLMILIIFTMYTLIFVRLYKQNRKWLLRMPKVHPERLRRLDDDNQSMLGDRKRSNVSNPSSSTKEIFSISTLKHAVPNQPDTISEENSKSNASLQQWQPTPTFSYADQRSSMAPKAWKRSQTEMLNLSHIHNEKKRMSLDVNKLQKSPVAQIKSKQGPSKLIQRTMHTANYVSRKMSNTRLDYRLDTNKTLKSRWSTVRDSVLSRKVSVNFVSRFRGTSTIDAPNRKSMFHSQKSKRPMHIKTTQVLFIVTLVYVIAFLPTFLMSNNVIPNHRVIYYMYFINNASNPIIYSFMNQRFRMEVAKLFCRK